MCVCVYVCLCIYIYIYAYVYMYICVYVCIASYLYIQTVQLAVLFGAHALSFYSEHVPPLFTDLHVEYAGEGIQYGILFIFMVRVNPRTFPPCSQTVQIDWSILSTGCAFQAWTVYYRRQAEEWAILVRGVRRTSMSALLGCPAGCSFKVKERDGRGER